MASTTSKIYVSGLPSSITEGDIRSVFEKYGEIKIVFISDEKNPQASCFVVFSNHEQAKNAINDLNYSDFTKDGETTIMKITYGDEETLTHIKDGHNCLLVEGFKDFVPESAIYEAFSKFGEVLYCTTPLDENQKPVGVCLVTCKTKEVADRIIKEVNNSVVNGNQITVKYAPEEIRA